MPEQEKQPEAPAVARHPIATILPAALVALAQAAPLNPQLPPLIAAHTGRFPPAECVTFDALKDWVETNCAPKLITPARRSRQPAEAFSVDVTFTDAETGRCNYSASRSGSDAFSFTQDEINSLLEDEDISFDDLVTEVEEILNEHIHDRTDPDMETDGDYEYNDHESDNIEDSDWSVDGSVRNPLRDYLRTTLTPERLENLGL